MAPALAGRGALNAMEPAARRLLFTGSRFWSDRALVRRVLADYLARHPLAVDATLVLVHGAARGMDSSVHAVALELGLKPEPHPAEDFGPWPQCGPLRNQHMVDLGAEWCFGFPSPRLRSGTRDCLARAKRAGIPTSRHPVPR